jgi:hypothetical protein
MNCEYSQVRKRPSQWSIIVCRKIVFSSRIFSLLTMLDDCRGVDSTVLGAVAVAASREAVALGANENVEVAGLGAADVEEEVNENVSLRGEVVVAAADLEANAMLANGLGLDGGSRPPAFWDVGADDIAVCCARVVSATGLDEARGCDDTVEAPDPLPLPKFRLRTRGRGKTGQSKNITGVHPT